MNKTLTETASREQLNRFIDDLRKELVLNRMQIAESAKQVKSLMARLETAQSSAESLRAHVVERERVEFQLRGEFEKHLLLKEAELARLRQLVAEKEVSIRALSRPEPLRQDNSELVSELAAFNKSLTSEMEARLSGKNLQVEKLQGMVERKEALIEKISSEFRRQLAAKDEQAKSLSEILRRNASGLASAEKYRGMAKISEDASRQVSDENIHLRRELEEARRVIELRDSILKDETKRFEEFSLEVSRKAEERVNEIVTEFSARELALKIGFEQAKSKLAGQELAVSAKQKEIDLALDNFASVSQRVLSFKTPDAMVAYKEKEVAELKKLLEQRAAQLSVKEIELKGVLEDIAIRERALSGRENELNTLLRKAEEKADSFASVENEIKQREDILHMQQQAFQKQMAMLEELGYEFREYKEAQVERQQPAPIVTEKPKNRPIKVLAGVPVPELKPVELTKMRAEQPRILKILKPRQAIPEKEALEAPFPPEPKLVIGPSPPPSYQQVKIPAQGIEVRPAPQETSHEAIFGKDREGFPEMDEISSMIEVAKEHGDSDDAIKASLAGSGYDREKVELAFKNVRIAKQF